MKKDTLGDDEIVIDWLTGNFSSLHCHFGSRNLDNTPFSSPYCLQNPFFWSKCTPFLFSCYTVYVDVEKFRVRAKASMLPKRLRSTVFLQHAVYRYCAVTDLKLCPYWWTDTLRSIIAFYFRQLGKPCILAHARSRLDSTYRSCAPDLKRR